MKRLLKRIYISIFLLVACSISGFSQSIDVAGGLGEYDQSEYPGYPTDGVFFASLTKAAGTIPAGTLGFSISLASQVPYTGAPLILPPGWVLESSSPTSLYIVNTNTDWTDNEIFVLIPVRAIAPRTDGGQTILVTYDNIGGDWVDPISNNSTKSSVLVKDVALPVTLTSFTATKENSTTLLKWATTMETNSDHFEIEKSLNGKNWGKIGSVVSNGESNSLKNYSYIDVNPSNGENLYRLKMVDKDQTSAYSRIQSVTFAGLSESDLSVYPNPTVDVLKIRDYSQVTKVSIFDMNGRAVLESGATPTGEINVRSLASGIYLVRVGRSNGLTSSQKIVVGK